MNLLQRAASSIAELRGMMAHTQLARMAFEHKVTTPRRPPSGKVRLLMTGREPVQLLDAETGEFLCERPTYREARDLADQLECCA